KPPGRCPSCDSHTGPICVPLSVHLLVSTGGILTVLRSPLLLRPTLPLSPLSLFLGPEVLRPLLWALGLQPITPDAPPSTKRSGTPSSLCSIPPSSPQATQPSRTEPSRA